MSLYEDEEDDNDEERRKKKRIQRYRDLTLHILYTFLFLQL